jgi:hypothetical protein
VSTYVLNKFNPTHGGANKQIMRKIYQGSRQDLFCKHIYSCRGLFWKRFSPTVFNTQVTQLFWEHQLTTGLPVRSSPGTQPHTFLEINSQHENIPNQNTSFVTTLWLVQYCGHDYSNRLYTLQRLYNLPTCRVPPHEHLSAGADPIKAITHLS